MSIIAQVRDVVHGPLDYYYFHLYAVIFEHYLNELERVSGIQCL